MTDICVIVPTIRQPECLKAYIKNARTHDFDTSRLQVLLITEDHCDVTGMEKLLDDLNVAGAVFDETRRQAWLDRHDLDAYSHLIPEASHAQTSFGLLYLWAHDHEYGILIDDDTAPHPADNFFGQHIENLNFEGSIETVASDERWVNVLYQNADEHGLYPRGYPYSAMDETITTTTTAVTDVVASQGLWTNIPDLDAVRILLDGNLDGQAHTRTTQHDFTRDFVAAEGHYLTVCSMNLAFRREIIPAFYQLPMDDNAWNIGRFDDIWSGVFLKRACDVLGTHIYNGRPLCEHNKAPRSTFSDLQYEAAGLELNEHLWTIIDDIGATATSYAGIYNALGNELASGDFEQYTNGAFLNRVGESMLKWLECLQALRGPDGGLMEVSAD